MRQFLVFTLFVSVIFVSHTAFSKQATTIDELAAMYNAELCADCHEDTHEEWKTSWHAKSIIDPRVLRTWRTFIKSGLEKSPQAKKRDLKDICLPCHVPQIKDASYDVGKQIADLIVIAVEDEDTAKRETAKKELSKLNINCLSCHNLKGSSDGKPKAKAIYGPGNAEEPPHKEFGFETIKSNYMKTPEFCAQCHHGCPPNMPSSVCPTLYTSYKEEYLAKGGKKTCQECHMREDGETSHKFPGIYEVDNAKKGIELTLNAKPTEYVYHLENRFVPAVVVQVDVKNTSGHGIPHG